MENTIYTYAQVYENALAYYGNDLAADAYTSKYALRNVEGELIESGPLASYMRQARELARIESKYPKSASLDEIYKAFIAGEISMQGSPFSGIGNDQQYQSLSNCFVIAGPEDSYGGIFRADEQQAQIMKRRGGVGHDLSGLRPRGFLTTNAARSSDGVTLFMQRFSNTTREVAQEGRRGALMMTVSVHHPDVAEFITIKQDRKKVTGANVSVRITDEFMQAVICDGCYEQRWPVEDTEPKFKRLVRAREIWDLIISSAHKCAEPGVLFWDTIIRNSPADVYPGFRTRSTNPCSELPLSVGDSCRLAITNSFAFVKNAFTDSAEFDWDRFRSAAALTQRLMDDLVDLEIESVDRIIGKVESDPEPLSVKERELALWKVIRQSARDGRRTGAGLTGVGDTVAALGLRYGSDESIKFIDELYRVLCVESYSESVRMASQRGSFPAWNAETDSKSTHVRKMLEQMTEELRDLYGQYGRRNIACNTTAPVGTISLLLGTTSGIEPAFMLSYKRRRKVQAGDPNVRVDFVDETGDSWQEYVVYHPGFELWMSASGKTEVSDSPYAGATANEIDWKKSIELQAAAQKWIDHAISRTVNLPAGTPVEVVDELYRTAWASGCKGCTIYVDGSRSGVLISTETPNPCSSGRPDELTHVQATKRPEKLPCVLGKVRVSVLRDESTKRSAETWCVLVSTLGGKPYEVFAGLAKDFRVGDSHTDLKIRKVKLKTTAGARYELIGDGKVLVRDITAKFDDPTGGSFTRVVSLSLRHGVPVQFVVEQLMKDRDSDMFSLAKAIARTLKQFIPDGTESTEKKCQECGSDKLIYQEGCVSCTQCSFSKCG